MREGLVQSGVEVFDIGVCGTEEVYFATATSKADGGIMVTASHNPKDYNGMKFVQRDSRPVDGESGLNAIRDLVQDIQGPVKSGEGSVRQQSYRAAYCAFPRNSDHWLRWRLRP